MVYRPFVRSDVVRIFAAAPVGRAPRSLNRSLGWAQAAIGHRHPGPRRRFCRHAVGYAKTKDSINAATLTEPDAALERELRGQSALLRSHDFKEGAAAFQQRRPPNFTDR
jgi:enoyl-CoA hydratase/carnithine racemase